MAAPREMESILRLAGVVDPSLKAAIKAANKEVGKLNKDQNRMLAKRSKQLQQFGKMMTKTITLPIIAMAAASAKAFIDFDNQQRSVQATLGATDAQMSRITESVKEIGATANRSGTEAMKGMKALVSSSYNAADSLRILPHAMILAQAAEMDTAQAAAYLTENMTTFGAAAWEAKFDVNQLAATVQSSNASFQGIGDSIATMGTDVRRFKGGTVEAYTALAELADQQIRALEEMLSRKLGKQVKVNPRVDPSLIGGMYIQVDGYFIDRTVKSRLRDLSASMKEGCSL